MATVKRTFTQKCTEAGHTDTYTFDVTFTIEETPTQYIYKYTSLTVTRTMRYAGTVGVGFLRRSDEKGGEFIFPKTSKSQTVSNPNGWFSTTVNKTHSSQSVSLGMDACIRHDNPDYNYYNKTFTMTVPAKTTYTISFDGNSGTGTPSSQTKWHGETLTITSQKPTKDGYVFIGWAESVEGASSGDVDYPAGASYSDDVGATLYAVWELAYTKPSINSFSVERCLQDGTSDDEGKYAEVTIAYSTYQSNNARFYGGDTYPYANNGASAEIQIGSHSVTATSASASGIITEIIGNDDFDTDRQYSVEVVLSDTETIQSDKSVTITGMLSMSFFPMDFNADGTALGIFRPAPDNKNGVFLGKDLYVSGNVYVQGMVGMIQMFAGSTAPSGWRFCDGSEVAVADYPLLHAVIGNTYGTPSDSDHFLLPDLQSRFPIGADTPYPLGDTGGSADAIVPYHRHSVSAVTNAITGGSHHHATYRKKNAGSGSAIYVPDGGSTSNGISTTDTTHTHNLPAHNTNYEGTSGEEIGANIPPYIGINFIICTGETS